MVTGCSRYSKDVTTPKLPPPPRSAQNRSGCSSALAVSTSPSAVTTSNEMTLSQVSPCFRTSQPDAAAEREARDAGLGDDAGRHGQAVDVRLAIELAERRRRAGRGRARALRIDVNALHPRQVDHQAAVAERAAADVVAAAANRHEQAVARART